VCRGEATFSLSWFAAKQLWEEEEEEEEERVYIVHQ